MFRLESPYALLALLLPLILWLWRRRLRKRPPALKVFSIAPFRSAGRSWKSRLSRLPAALFLLAWTLLTIALARPQLCRTQIKDVTQGIAMEMVLDRSGSMEQEMNYGGRAMNRLETVKSVFADFVFGNGKTLKGRHNDLIGVIGFAHYPYTFCPLTLDHNALKFALTKMDLIRGAGDENGTAIGDAVAMAVARLQAAEKTLAAQTEQ
ncbi:MAG: VWA domain-containing protein, partial [Victivallales bacterium]|nr:VWA domain-containing protein [Victivallales bacterium]